MKLKKVHKLEIIILDVIRHVFYGGLFIDRHLPKKQIISSGIIEEVPELADSDLLVRSKINGEWYALIREKIYRADAEIGSWLNQTSADNETRIATTEGMLAKGNVWEA